jgi:hypothetical protein
MSDALRDFQSNLVNYTESMNAIRSLQKRIDFEDSPREIVRKLIPETLGPLVTQHLGNAIYALKNRLGSSINDKLGSVTKELQNRLGPSDMPSELTSAPSESIDLGSRFSTRGDAPESFEMTELNPSNVPITTTDTEPQTSLGPNDTFRDIISDSDKFRDWASNQTNLADIDDQTLEMHRQYLEGNPERASSLLEENGISLDDTPNDISSILNEASNSLRTTGQSVLENLQQSSEITGGLRADSTIARALGQAMPNQASEGLDSIAGIARTARQVANISGEESAQLGFNVGEAGEDIVSGVASLGGEAVGAEVGAEALSEIPVIGPVLGAGIGLGLSTLIEKLIPKERVQLPNVSTPAFQSGIA